MRPVYCLGVDVAKRKVSYHLLDAQRRSLAAGTAPSNQPGLEQLLAVLARAGLPSDCLVVMEATGVLHLSWAEALSARGYPVVVLNPLASKRLYSGANVLRDSKTDRIDAHSLAELGLLRRADLQRFGYHRDTARFAVQRLQTVREGLRHALTNQKRAYLSLLDLVFPELADLVDVHTQRVRALLANAATPAVIAKLSVRRLRAAFAGQTEAVRTAARQSLACEALAQASVPALHAVLASIESTENQLRHLDAELKARLAAAVDVRHIALARTVPGLGEKTVVAVLAQLPPALLQTATRKKAAARLQALMGNDPRLQESGQWKGQTRMSKRGNRSLRTAMFQAAFCATLHDEPIRAYYQKKRAEGKHHKVALTHVMRILTRRLVAVLMTGKPYEVCYPKLN